MTARIDPLQVLEARAQARAMLFANGDYEDIGEAVTPLRVYAHEAGLDDLYGDVTIWTIIREAFKGTADI
jgi:hypothetical protein